MPVHTPIVNHISLTETTLDSPVDPPIKSGEENDKEKTPVFSVNSTLWLDQRVGE